MRGRCRYAVRHGLDSKPCFDCDTAEQVIEACARNKPRPKCRKLREDDLSSSAMAQLVEVIDQVIGERDGDDEAHVKVINCAKISEDVAL
jgi:hypothetical protein